MKSGNPRRGYGTGSQDHRLDDTANLTRNRPILQATDIARRRLDDLIATGKPALWAGVLEREALTWLAARGAT